MLVEIKNLVKRYNDKIAVDNVSFSIKPGDILGLLGPNGAGKTTVINALMGLTKIDGGEITIFGKNLKSNERELKKDMGLVPQDIAIFYDLTAHENVSFFGKLYGLKGKILKERVEEALNFTGLWDKRNELPKKLSGGMKRRLNIACAIVHHPKLIILDEPTVGIDPQSRNHILESIKQLNEMGSTVIYTSHYMEEIETICSNIIIIDNGKVMAMGTKEELKELISFEEKIVIDLDNVNYTIVENIKNISGVTDCLLDKNILTVTSQKNSKNLNRIIDAITSGNGEILSLNVEKPNLEDVFLTLTGRKLRD
jgi:ABC-2 type transport system ATP-binding protein